MKNITRIDNGRVHCWWVRISINGERFQCSFTDRKYGGKEAAYDVAVEYLRSLQSEQIKTVA